MLLMCDAGVQSNLLTQPPPPPLFSSFLQSWSSATRRRRPAATSTSIPRASRTAAFAAVCARPQSPTSASALASVPLALSEKGRRKAEPKIGVGGTGVDSGKRETVGGAAIGKTTPGEKGEWGRGTGSEGGRSHLGRFDGFFRHTRSDATNGGGCVCVCVCVCVCGGGGVLSAKRVQV